MNTLEEFFKNRVSFKRLWYLFMIAIMVLNQKTTVWIFQKKKSNHFVIIYLAL